MFKPISEKILCTFCKLEHRVYVKKEVSVFDVIIMLSVTGLMAFAIWGGPDLRSMLIFMSLAFVLQVFLRVRYRESVKCPHCGFDPILYKQNPEMAAQKVKTYIDARKDNPEFLLKPQLKIKPIYLSKDQMKLLEKDKELDQLGVSQEENLSTPMVEGESNSPAGQLI